MADSLINIFSDNHLRQKNNAAIRPFTNSENIGKVFASENRPTKSADPGKVELKKSFLSNISTAIQTTPARSLTPGPNLYRNLQKQKVNIYTDPENECLDDSGLEMEMIEFTKPEYNGVTDVYTMLDMNDFNNVDLDPYQFESECSTPEPKHRYSFSMESDSACYDDVLTSDFSFSKSWDIDIPSYE